jgi:predicted Rossmann fold nucleotide-binding protein DprA/Smf involved in DNA uptake
MRQARQGGIKMKMMEDEEAVKRCLHQMPKHIDTLCAESGLPIHRLSAALMILELRKEARQLPGKMFTIYEKGNK